MSVWKSGRDYKIPQQNMLPVRNQNPITCFLAINAVLTQIQFRQIWSRVWRETNIFDRRPRYFL